MRSAGMMLILALFLPVLSFSQDEELEARKLYLKASSLIRKEQYRDAKVLEKIVTHHVDTEIALKADELDEILDKIEAASLPRVPGCYLRMRSGKLVKLGKERIARACYAKMEAKGIVEEMNPELFRQDQRCKEKGKESARQSQKIHSRKPGLLSGTID